MTSTIVHRGTQAEALLGSPDFIEQWRKLWDSCAHATPFQKPGFVLAWYSAYRARWEPVIVTMRGQQGELEGLWLLAWSASSGKLAHAGAQQAEYHAWLALPGQDARLLSSAWPLLAGQLPFATLQFKYLPTPELADIVQLACGRVNVLRRARPLMRLDAEEIRASLAKKGNKSRFNRLKRLGELEFKRVTDPAELARVFDELIAFYDFRQGAVNDTSPFREDQYKKPFHLALFAAAAEDLVCTVSYLAGRPIAAYWGMGGARQSHLGMLMHSPFLAEHSPGKLHMMQLSELLLQQGVEQLDLTPGGDPWKERFANAHDEVAEVVAYASVATWQKQRAAEFALGVAKRALGTIGSSPAAARSLVAKLRRQTPAVVVRKLRKMVSEEREFRVYRADRAMAQRFAADARVRCNSLEDLLLFEPGESWQDRGSFLSSALARLENGNTSWSVAVDGKLAHCGWLAAQSESRMSEVGQTLVFPPNSVALYDFYTSPDFRGRGFYRATIGHMLHAAFADESVRYAYISVLADNHPSRHVIEKMGFAFQGSFFWKRAFGRVNKSADTFPTEPESCAA